MNSLLLVLGNIFSNWLELCDSRHTGTEGCASGSKFQLEAEF